jgi:hypothetical protein
MRVKHLISILAVLTVGLLVAGCSDDKSSSPTTDTATTVETTEVEPSTSTTSAPAPATTDPEPDSPSTSTTVEAPPSTMDLEPSATPSVIDNFPILDPSDFPASEPEIVIVGGWSQRSGEYGWVGIVGSPATSPDTAPTTLTQVQAMPISAVYNPQSIPGRRDGVRESTFDNLSSLSWEVGEIRFVITGPDIELLYELIDRIHAIEQTSDRGGYEFVGGLPDGIVELEPPRPLTAGWFPGILDADESARLSLYMDDQSPLHAMVQGGGDVQPVTVNGHPGYISTRNGSVIGLAFAIATDETVSISYSPYSEAELIAIAEQIEFTDEATWRDHYGITWGNGQGDSPPGY